jgi:hypothetical protein
MAFSEGLVCHTPIGRCCLCAANADQPQAPCTVDRLRASTGTVTAVARLHEEHHHQITKFSHSINAIGSGKCIRYIENPKSANALLLIRCGHAVAGRRATAAGRKYVAPTQCSRLQRAMADCADQHLRHSYDMAYQIASQPGPCLFSVAS